MSPKNTSESQESSIAQEQALADSSSNVSARHSDVVPKRQRDTDSADPWADTLLTAPHLSWPEQKSLRVPDDTRGAWMRAYESGFDQAFESWHRGDWLIPLVYASGSNDARLTRALLRFAHEVALRLPDSDEALAVLEVAESTLEGDIGKDLCLRIAENLIDEAYERFTADRRFDRYFFCHCAAAVTRLTARVDQADSARDAIEAIQSATAALRMHGESAEEEVPKLAARFIREELGHAISREAVPGSA